jgi:hypothetical protein
VLVREDPEINFDWDGGSPGVGVPPDKFSARWRQTIQFKAGRYRFHLRMDDGARLWVDDVLILDAWMAGEAREVTAEAVLTSGDHRLRVEYFEGGGPALIRFWWDNIGPTGN